MGISRFFSLFHIRDDRLPFVVTDLPSAIHMNDTDARNRPFGIVVRLVIPCKRGRTAQPDEDILIVWRIIQEIGSRILIPIRHQIYRAHAQVRDRIDDFNIVSCSVSTPDIPSDRGHPVGVGKLVIP